MDEERKEEAEKLKQFSQDELIWLICEMSKESKKEKQKQYPVGEGYNEITIGDISIKSSTESLNKINKMMNTWIKDKKDFIKEVNGLKKNDQTYFG